MSYNQILKSCNITNNSWMIYELPPHLNPTDVPIRSHAEFLLSSVIDTARILRRSPQRTQRDKGIAMIRAIELKVMQVAPYAASDKNHPGYFKLLPTRDVATDHARHDTLADILQELSENGDISLPENELIDLTEEEQASPISVTSPEVIN